jgi:hypothetical protein
VHPRHNVTAGAAALDQAHRAQSGSSPDTSKGGSDTQLLWFESISDKHSWVRPAKLLGLLLISTTDSQQRAAVRWSPPLALTRHLLQVQGQALALRMSGNMRVEHSHLQVALRCHVALRVQQVTGLLKLVFVISVASFLVLTIMQSISPSKFVLSRPYFAAHTAIASALLLSLAIVAARWGYRMAVASRLQRAWSPPQRYAVATIAGKAAIMLTILASDLVVTSAMLAQPHFFCDMPAVLTAAQLARWTGWNTLLLLMTLDNRAPLLWAAAEGGEGGKNVQRRSLLCHWPKALVWLVIEGATC